MRRRAPARLAKLAGWLVSGAAGMAAALFLLAWSGIYNVAASTGHWAVVDWFLAFGMRNSVDLRANAITAPVLDRPDLIRLGAAHFHGGCAFCHGAPGVPVSPIARQMLPSPPHLATSMRTWTDEELFWIVQHGIKYTGMPGWVALERADEIWAVVAFLKRLPEMDANSYRELALGRVELASQSAEASACARCHGAADSGPASALVPILHGQPEPFLIAALKEYAQGSRRSGIMQPLAADLGAHDMQRLAAYYAKLPPRRPDNSAHSSTSERGRQLATEGDPVNGIPACEPCHGRSGLARYPRLAGQNAAYMEAQLGLWAAGHHTSTAGGAIMGPIAQRLSEADIKAVSAYFAAQAPEQVGAKP
ncbi:MAG TPA: c-type cytochrome [Hyphomicrobiaceae bacterium]|nr:c-type cytochrome [Hyphomicrobiaceae bacterium]